MQLDLSEKIKYGFGTPCKENQGEESGDPSVALVFLDGRGFTGDILYQRFFLE
ncbi:hypothetical protein [Leptospira adleri]|uniref:hypothetical protein n=1 Tax=Leptospira adleri TaxID=2023186 RepID=UPI0013FE1E68|nr:hypothetical protein [Leptospira adleri]